MTAQPSHHETPVPPMRTFAELRAALSHQGYSGDLQQFEAELDAADLDDLSQVREITQAYRHRVLLRSDPQGAAALARSTEDVTTELRRKLDEAGAR